MIHLTYTGSCKIDGVTILCSNMDAFLDQKVLFFDHILGLQDKLVDGTNGMTKGPAGDGDLSNVQKRTYRYSPAIARASISGPIPAEGFKRILNKAVHGGEVEVVMTFYRSQAPRVTVGKAIISSLSIDVKAADIATFSMDIVGAEYKFTTGAGSSEASCDKLLTWDRCSIEATPVSHDMSSFNLSINNPPVPIYTAKWSKDAAQGEDITSGGMMPQKIRIGMQEVTGSIGIYGPSVVNNPSVGTVKFDLNGSGRSVNVVFYQPKDDASTGPYIRTISFTGVKEGTIWGDL